MFSCEFCKNFKNILLTEELRTTACDTITILNSYFKDRKQNVKIKNFCSIFPTVPSGVPQGVFNMFSNDLSLFLTKSELHSFADGNTITAATCDYLADLLNLLETEPELVVKWFKQNEIVVNSDKFQALFLNKQRDPNRHTTS